ncbi:MAG: hypothetical protein HYU75_05750 [Betaproteobacteria bacterium]|nr:hypothetical protein [Betaproteobacteria bacterium]
MEISKDIRFVHCRICGGDTFQASGATNWKLCDKCDTLVCPRRYRNDLKKAPTCTAHEPPGNWLTSSAGPNSMVFK